MPARSSLRKVATALVRLFALRNSMLPFFRKILYYAVAYVIEPNKMQFENAMRKAQTTDAIMVHHAHFLGHVGRTMLIAERGSWALGEICISFTSHTDSFETLVRVCEDNDVVQSHLKERSYPATLAKIETSFDFHLGKFMEGLSALSKSRANVHLANLCERLHGGEYYSLWKEQSSASFHKLQI
ncbi:unnamed protein product [Agarophyton chilense]